MIRTMRLIVMFDLPSTTASNHKAYGKWHKFLIRTGFIMMTESVYSRIVMNRSISESIKKLVRKNLPPKGIIQMLEITEKQYSEMEYCLGESKNNFINSDERYVEI